MFLSPSSAPPVVVNLKEGGQASPKSSPVTRANSSPLRILADKTNGSTIEACSQGHEVPKMLKIPSVILDAESISAAMAARIASSLVGHVLFLKSQIPFPVAQLGRMPHSPANTKASKKREELVNAIDTLSSHLTTTFAALSTAFAQRGTVALLADTENESRSNVPCTTGGLHSPAHMAIVIGPSVGAAKARVMLVIDGLEVKDSGTRVIPKESASRSPSPSGAEDHHDAASESASDSEYEDCEDRCRNNSQGSDSGSEPPLSRSPSPCSSEVSSRSETAFQVHEAPPLPAATQSVARKLVPFCETPSTPPLRASAQKPLPLSARPTVQQSVSVPGRVTLIPRRVQEPVAPSFEEEQQALRACDRLLSRTLANACAEDDGGLSAELAPTQMHILIRAPRRFHHPAWIPRQNLTRSLENTLETFLKDSVVHESEETLNQKKRVPRVGIKTEGVWVGCKTRASEPTSTSQTKEDGESSSEEDEMIWWVWDGKIVGFSDW